MGTLFSRRSGCPYLCIRFEYQPHDEATITDLAAIAAQELKILPATKDADCPSITSNEELYGETLRVRYSTVQAITSEGRPLSQGELGEGSKRYCSCWGDRT